MRAVPAPDTDCRPPGVTLRDLRVFALGLVCGMLLILGLLAAV